MSFAEGPGVGGRSETPSAFKKLLQALVEQHDRDLAEAVAQGRRQSTDSHPAVAAFARPEQVQWPIETTSEPEATAVPEASQLRGAASGEVPLSPHAVPDCQDNDFELQKSSKETAATSNSLHVDAEIDKDRPQRPSFTRGMSDSLDKASKLNRRETAQFSSSRKLPILKTRSANPAVSAIGRCVRSQRFDHITAFLLVSNALFIGVQVEYEFAEETPPLVLAIDYMFCLFFIAELALRMWSFGCRQFWVGSDERGWNWFDSGIVSLTTFDVLLSLLMQGKATLFENISVLRIVRMVRITRVLRIIRVMKVFKDLRVLMVAIASTMKTGVYAIMLIATAMWVFGIAISQLVAAHIGEKKALAESISPDDDLLRYFGSLWKSLLTLYMTISGGLDWKDAANPLFEINPLGIVFFLVYTLLMVLCVMNVLTGLFVHAAIESANQDTESVIQYQMAEKQRYIDLLKALFTDLDDTGNGRCSFEEFENHLSDAKMQALLGSLEIEVRDAMAIFELFDHDHSGEIDLDEFITGCITLRGNAKAVQMEKLKNMSQSLELQLKGIENNLRIWQQVPEKVA